MGHAVVDRHTFDGNSLEGSSVPGPDPMTQLATRRTALIGLAMPAMLLCGRALAQAPTSAPAVGNAAGLRFRNVVVDADRLAALGNPAGADAVTRVLQRELRTVFADLMAPGDPRGATLLARISSLYLPPYAGGGRAFGPRGGGDAGNDNIEGVGIVVAGGRPVSEVPILAVLDPGYSGVWYLPNIDELRLVSICHQFAWWLRREMAV